MTVYLQDRFVREAEARVSVFDRGFLYGDGLFETVRAYGGRLFLWEGHWERLVAGAGMLGIPLPGTGPALREVAGELLRRNGHGDGTVRIQVTRGPGVRGYSPRGAGPPTLVITTHPAAPLEAPFPGPWRLRTASLRLWSGDPTVCAKTTSKLLQVLARAEAEAEGADEALLLNDRGEVAETAAGNVFWFEGGRWCTPMLESGGLAGVTRRWMLGLLGRLGWPHAEVRRGVEGWREVEAVFVTLSSHGLVAVSEWDGHRWPADPRIGRLQEGYREAVRSILSH
ncbi:MAG: aminotransferase class IV [Verrucomicrobiae bacterium]|nr:aminotransferase class IV [Verrucomicrobiae bacterium]